MRLLIVDREQQDPSLLTNEGYQVRVVPDDDSALRAVDEWKPHAVIVDRYEPHRAGVELCRQIRAMSIAPIIVLSIDHPEAAKVAILDAGADDYLTKPFGINEYLARIRAVLRRASADTSDSDDLEIGNFRIDFAARRVHLGGHEVRLTRKEFELFAYLARRPNRVIEHRQLLEAVWGGSWADPAYLRVFVGQLRRKLEPEPSAPRYLLTEPWFGYRFDPAARARGSHTPYGRATERVARRRRRSARANCHAQS